VDDGHGYVGVDVIGGYGYVGVDVIGDGVWAGPGMWAWTL
jgi:hypothetical protein